MKRSGDQRNFLKGIADIKTFLMGDFITFAKIPEDFAICRQNDIIYNEEPVFSSFTFLDRKIWIFGEFNSFCFDEKFYHYFLRFLKGLCCFMGE